MTENATDQRQSLFINGEWQGAPRSFEVRNPATGEIIAHLADGDAQATRAAIAAAEGAQDAWAAKPAYERAAILYKAHQLLLDNSEELAQLLTREQGKPIKAARTEVKYAADFLIWFAEEAKRIYGQTIPSPRADQRFIVMHQPIGVVGAITPWNYPISMITRKIAPALAAGCTAVLKPAHQTPLIAVEVFRLLEEAGVPPGVVNLVTTSDAQSFADEILASEAIGKITFTGSTRVGKMIAARAAEQMKRVSLELGGHAPFIAFEDADPVHAAKGAAMVKLLNTGQACISPNRLFVHRSIIAPFLQTLADRVRKMKAGNGLVDGVAVGPLINQPSLDRMEAQVSDALAKGATLVTGGERLTDAALAHGFFFAPTVLANVTPDMRIYREETFGPIAPVIAFDDEQDVVRMANDTRYGLASYIYTQNLARALRVAEALKFGMVGINDINPTAACAPFGGVKESGLGREGAQEGLHEYLETKLIGISI